MNLRGAAWKAVAAALLSGLACGEDRPALPADPFEGVQPTAVLSSEERAAASPRWVALARLEGTGDEVRTVGVPGRVIQWRVRFACRGATRLEMRIDPAPPGGGPLVDSRCPGRGTAVGVRGGRLTLTVRAGGPWTAEFEQQVDAPLAEPPLDGMTPERLVARGRLHPVEKRGSGAAALYRLADGRLALRLDPFATSPSTDLEIWALRSRRPRTSRQAVRRRHVLVAMLKSTAGSQNYVLPRRLGRAGIRSLVLWCEPLHMAYASAGLKPR